MKRLTTAIVGALVVLVALTEYTNRERPEPEIAVTTAMATPEPIVRGSGKKENVYVGEDGTSQPLPDYEINVAELAATQMREFGGHPCTDDCSGHEAGYEWAEAQGVTDAFECSGTSQSFVEGCEAYAEEQSQETE